MDVKEKLPLDVPASMLAEVGLIPPVKQQEHRLWVKNKLLSLVVSGGEWQGLSSDGK